MRTERVAQRARCGVPRLRPSLRLLWWLGSLALGVMMLVGASESGRTFASLVTDARGRGEVRSAPLLQSLPLRVSPAPLDHGSRELELLLSIELGEIAHAESLLAAGVSANGKDLQGWTPLMLAALHNRIALIPQLYASGADPNVQNAKGTTALMLAANNGLAPTRLS